MVIENGCGLFAQEVVEARGFGFFNGALRYFDGCHFSAFVLRDSRANLVAVSAPGLRSHQAGCPLGKRADGIRVELEGLFQPDVFCRIQHVSKMRRFKVVLQYLLSVYAHSLKVSWRNSLRGKPQRGRGWLIYLGAGGVELLLLEVAGVWPLELTVRGVDPLELTVRGVELLEFTVAGVAPLDVTAGGVMPLDVTAPGVEVADPVTLLAAAPVEDRMPEEVAALRPPWRIHERRI